MLMSTELNSCGILFIIGVCLILYIRFNVYFRRMNIDGPMLMSIVSLLCFHESIGAGNIINIIASQLGPAILLSS